MNNKKFNLKDEGYMYCVSCGTMVHDICDLECTCNEDVIFVKSQNRSDLDAAIDEYWQTLREKETERKLELIHQSIINE